MKYVRYLLIPLTLPQFLGWVPVALFTLFGMTRKHRFDKHMWTWECQWADWVAREPYRLLAKIKWPFGHAVVDRSTNTESRTLWKYGTTFGYAIVYHPDALRGDTTVEADTRQERHEDVHVRQGQDESVLGFLVGLSVAIAINVIVREVSGDWQAANQYGARAWAGIWISSIFWRAPNFLTAWLRGGHPYRDAEHERSAYAQTDTFCEPGKSWLEDHNRRATLR